MNHTKSGTIFNIQHFSNEDGPGIRTTVFLKGCNLHCPWCHNPESQSMKTDIMFFDQKCMGCKTCLEICPRNDASSQMQTFLHPVFSEECLRCGTCAEQCPAEALVAYGRKMTVDEVTEEILQDRDLYEMSGGGVTISGGEPLLQVDFLEALLCALKEKGIHTAIETAGCYEPVRLERVLPYVDLVFMDLKCLDEQKHKEVIGASNRQILENIKLVGAHDVDLVVRTPVIGGFNDMELPEIAEFVKRLPGHVKAELLPYHEICSGKYAALHREFQVAEFRVPTDQEMNRYRDFFEGRILT